MGLAEIQKLKASARLTRESGGEIKPTKPIRFRGEKMKEAMKLLRPLIIIFLSKHKFCEIQGPNCTKLATCVHHSEGRIGEKLLDVKTFVPSCTSCNLWCETNDAEAREKGFKKSKFKKSN